MSDLSRRGFVRSAAFAAAGVLAGCARGRGGDRRLVVADPGGEWQQAAAEAYYRPFREETGIEVLYAARPALALGKLKAMVEAGNVEWDLTILADYLSYRGASDGLIEPIEAGGFDTSSLIPRAVLPHFVGNDVFATVMAHDIRKWPAGGGPRTWADFWNVRRFPGRRAMSGIGYGPLEFALLADGVPMDRLYPLDVNRALRKMDQIQAHVSVWWTTGAQQSQLMSTGEVDLILGWNARLQHAIDQGAPFAIEWNQGMYQVEGWVIPKGAAHRADALAFLRFALRADRQAEFASRLAYGPVNLRALAEVGAARASLLPTFEGNLSRMFAMDARWAAEHVDDLQSRWTHWKAR
ncbi:MAG: ABC transporter substrate-binding protein [Gemmatimonadetes bacterium]|nr:ABC transporter substrate-binding protein [Gemmatimonadota bacterium]